MSTPLPAIELFSRIYSGATPGYYLHTGPCSIPCVAGSQRRWNGNLSSSWLISIRTELYGSACAFHKNGAEPRELV